MKAALFLGAVTLALGIGGAFATASGADEMEGVEIVVPATTTGSVPCPKLTQKKYPWLTCSATPWGAVYLDGPDHHATWDQERLIPGYSPFVNGTGYWGPSKRLGYD